MRSLLYQHAFEPDDQVGCFPHPVHPSTRWKRYELWWLCCSSSSGCRSECQRCIIQNRFLSWPVIGRSTEWPAVHARKEMSS
ncbi:hypothetical protein CBS147321_6840 [Aspergillus niger]|nr:hypothetical protein CBS147321_6840 [Aspergillus niger]KAI2968190.1 hypothetical protein CBS147323_4382 [Aspergillus niger]KAI3012325.1 hypothetical protein CBS147346_702 [Aspergillus niger]KAI3032849.1 hypothetical protein CBS147347_1318 [Aspergillus niger]